MNPLKTETEQFSPKNEDFGVNIFKIRVIKLICKNLALNLTFRKVVEHTPCKLRWDTLASSRHVVSYLWETAAAQHDRTICR